MNNQKPWIAQCRQGEIEIHLVHVIKLQVFLRAMRKKPCITTVLPSYIHGLSWISATLGIRDPVPLDNFPWHVPRTIYRGLN
jgi:hypothetical protein